MKMKSDDHKYHFDCCKCGKPVGTSLDSLNADKLCHDCGRLKKLVEHVLADKGLMSILKHLMEMAGVDPSKTHEIIQQAVKKAEAMRKEETSEPTLEQKIAQKQAELVEQSKEGKTVKVDYTCPVCHEDGQFQLPEGSDQEDIEHIKALEMCPACLVKKTTGMDVMGQVAMCVKKPGHGPRFKSPYETEGPIGPTPTITDPDDIPPVKDKGADEQGLAA